MDAPNKFPTPIGGVVQPSEFAACIIFLILYAVLVPTMVYRAWDRRSRTFLLFGSWIAVIDRVVIFTFRLLATRREGVRISNTFLRYSQLSFGLGYVAIGHDLVDLLRCTLVNPTFGYGEAGRYDESPASQTKDGYFEPPSPGDQDNPAQRATIRSRLFWLSLAFLASSIPAIVSLGWYSRSNFRDESKGERLYKLRYASAAVALFLILLIMGAASWSRRKQARVCQKAINMIFVISTLAATVAVYRFAVMHNRTADFDAMGPGTLNSPTAKALFYIFQILPEWLSVALILGFNTKKLFSTGYWGDWRGKDDTPNSIKKRKERQAKKDAKKAARLGRDAEANGSSIPLRSVEA